MGTDLTFSKMIVERDGVEVEVDIEGYVEFSIDTKYGEDADGGLGEVRTFIEDVTDICAYDIDSLEFDLTESEIKEAKKILAEKFLMD